MGVGVYPANGTKEEQLVYLRALSAKENDPEVIAKQRAAEDRDKCERRQWKYRYDQGLKALREAASKDPRIVDGLQGLLAGFAISIDQDAVGYEYSFANRELKGKGLMPECSHVNRSQNHNGWGEPSPGRYTCLDCREHVYIREEEKAFYEAQRQAD